MKKRWAVIFFLFSVGFLIMLGVSAYAEENDETNKEAPDLEYEEEAVPAKQQVSPGEAAPADSSAVGNAPVMEQAQAPVLGGEPQKALPSSGVIEINSYKYPVSLFVPQDYRTDRTYSMVMIAPAEFSKAQEQIDFLKNIAVRKNIFVLAFSGLWPKKGTVPYNLDNWLFTVKKDVIEQYPINKTRIYLFGKDSGAEYAAYLATKHPSEFSAVALLGQAWDGQFSQLVHPSSGVSNQIPFYIALKAGTDAKARNQTWFDQFQKKGYLLYLVDYQKEDDLNTLEFKEPMYNWLETTSQSWATAQAKSHQGWKGKLKKGVKDFFAV